MQASKSKLGAGPLAPPHRQHQGAGREEEGFSDLLACLSEKSHQSSTRTAEAGKGDRPEPQGFRAADNSGNPIANWLLSGHGNFSPHPGGPAPRRPDPGRAGPSGGSTQVDRGSNRVWGPDPVSRDGRAPRSCRRPGSLGFPLGAGSRHRLDVRTDAPPKPRRTARGCDPQCAIRTPRAAPDRCGRRWLVPTSTRRGSSPCWQIGRSSSC